MESKVRARFLLESGLASIGGLLASSSRDFQNVARPVAIGQLAPTAGFFEDDGQPFPLYGWLDVYWQEPGIVVE